MATGTGECNLHKNKMEHATGIEPAYSAWEADVLPLNYACISIINLILKHLCFNKKEKTASSDAVVLICCFDLFDIEFTAGH